MSHRTATILTFSTILAAMVAYFAALPEAHVVPVYPSELQP